MALGVDHLQDFGRALAERSRRSHLDSYEEFGEDRSSIVVETHPDMTPSSPSSAEADSSTISPFSKTWFDPAFPVHNLCDAEHSGGQTDQLEWGESADKLLKLFNDGTYNMFLAPGQVQGTATNVSVAIYIESMSSFRSRTMDFEVDMYVGMGWYDRRLANNCTHPILIRHKLIADMMWIPDLYFLNSKFAYLQEVTTPNFMIIVYPDGLVLKAVRADVTLSCMMDLQLFPMDKQECPIVVQSYAYIENLLNLSWHVDPPNYPIARNPDLRLNDMIIVGMKYASCSGPYALFRGHGNWSCIKALIVMRRLVLFHLIQTYIPTGMLVVVSWMTFWLDPRHSPARVSLTITSLLTLTTMSNGARQDLPQVSYVKAMDVWQAFSQALIFLVLLEYSFVSYFVTRKRVGVQCEHRRQELADQAASGLRRLSLAAGRRKKSSRACRFHQPPILSPSTPISAPIGVNSRLLPSPAQENGPSANNWSSFHYQLVVQPHMSRKKSSMASRKSGAMSGVHPQLQQQQSAQSVAASVDDMRPCKKCQWEDEMRAKWIDRCSRVLFPSVFVFFCLFYWLYYGWWMSGDGVETRENGTS